MKKSYINRVSDKTGERNQRWKCITLERIEMLADMFGYIVCEYCGGYGNLTPDAFNQVWGHHIDWDRNNCTSKNCMIAHNRCNTHIHDNNEHPQQFHGIKEVCG